MSLSMIQLDSIIGQHGFEHFGYAKLQKPLSFSIYQQWIEAGKHAEMDYLERHLSQKADPSLVLAQARSALILAVPYLPHPKPVLDFPLKAAHIAYYAQGEDYHFWIKARLQNLITELKNHLPNETFLPLTDSGPVLERDLAYQAGLGWFGKNTCLLDRQRGSLFFIAEILTSAEWHFQADIKKDMCGACTRCLDACPTGALTKAKELDARLCISYWTIEAKKTAPVELRPQLGDWLFGCDICQTVCPWNEKNFSPHLLSQPAEGDLVSELGWLLTSSNKSIERQLKGTPLSRAGGKGLKRNALVIIANKELKALKALVQSLEFNDPDMEELKQWTLSKLD